jgi:uridine kinase
MLKKHQPVVNVTFADGSERCFPIGTTLLQVSLEFQSSHKYPIVAGKVFNEIKELSYEINEDCRVEFIDLSYEDGMRIYKRSLCFILIKAVNDLFPDRKVVIQHSIGSGLYCEVTGSKDLSAEEVSFIQKRMREIVDAKIPFVKRVMSVEEAKEIFKKSGRMDRYHAVEHRIKPYVTMYNCGGLDDYFYGYMVPDTGYIKEFSLVFYPPGLVLMSPTKSDPGSLPFFNPQPRLFGIFNEYKRWNRILEIENVGALNDIIKEGLINDIIRVAEALHEKKIAQIADMISGSDENKKVVLISGPSSSGKTTFAQRLSVQLRVNGLKPVTISLDDYFVDREVTPLDENGEYDYETIDAIDVELFNRHLNNLIALKEVEIPVFNFETGKREPRGRLLKLNKDNIIIIEGIHGLNEKLTRTVRPENKFKIYVSALTSLNIDDHNRIPTTDTRIIRRIVRDHQFRGNSAAATIDRWPSVRRGEEKNIFPFQEQADVMFNSALVYELSVLKTIVEPLLQEKLQ